MLFRNWLKALTARRPGRLSIRRRHGRQPSGQSLQMKTEFVVSAMAERLEDRTLLSVTTALIDINPGAAVRSQEI